MCSTKVAAICDSFNLQFMLQREVNFYLSVTAKCPTLKKVCISPNSIQFKQR